MPIRMVNVECGEVRSAGDNMEQDGVNQYRHLGALCRGVYEGQTYAYLGAVPQQIGVLVSTKIPVQ